LGDISLRAAVRRRRDRRVLPGAQRDVSPPVVLYLGRTREHD